MIHTEKKGWGLVLKKPVLILRTTFSHTTHTHKPAHNTIMWLSDGEIEPRPYDKRISVQASSEALMCTLPRVVKARTAFEQLRVSPDERNNIIHTTLPHLIEQVLATDLICEFTGEVLDPATTAERIARYLNQLTSKLVKQLF